MSKFAVGDLVLHTRAEYGVGDVTEVDSFGEVQVNFPNVFSLPVWFLEGELDLYDNWEEEAFELIETTCYGQTPQGDAVNSPDHYNNGEIECIDYLKDNMSWEGYTGYLEGNCKKYMHRWRHKKKPLEDLKKASWYLNRLISELEGPEESC